MIKWGKKIRFLHILVKKGYFLSPKEKKVHKNAQTLHACHKTKKSSMILDPMLFCFLRVWKNWNFNFFDSKIHFGLPKMPPKGYHRKNTKGLISFFLGPVGKKQGHFYKTNFSFYFQPCIYFFHFWPKSPPFKLFKVFSKKPKKPKFWSLPL